MQIRLRPSGGRGEYELAGSHGAIRVSDLYGLDLFLDFGVDLRLPLYATADIHDGKPRIRLDDPQANVHAARLIAAVLLIPAPIREIRKTGIDSSVKLTDCAFSSISVDVVLRTSTYAVLRPREIVAINSAGSSLGIDVLQRYEHVQRMWAAASVGSSEIDSALSMHRAACQKEPLVHKDVISTASGVLPLLSPDTYLNPHFGPLSEAPEFSAAPPVLPEDDPSNPIQVNREIRKRLVLRAERGPEGRAFRQLVNSAYGYRCAFSGIALPPLSKGYSPGVDAAHIYPWSQQGSNDITNGICLSKQMHWAFDEGIVKLIFDTSANLYLISLGDDVQALASTVGFDLQTFAASCGPIPSGRLPQNPASMPSKRAIELYNNLMFPPL